MTPRDTFLGNCNSCLSGVCGDPLVQATWRTAFEDGWMIGNQSEAGNSLQRVCTIPEINVIIDPGGTLDLDPLNLQFANICDISIIVLGYSCVGRIELT